MDQQLLMEPIKINHPYLTAIRRTRLSAPARYLLQHGLLKERILDFGCGLGFDTDELRRQGLDITGYDCYYVRVCLKRARTLCAGRGNDGYRPFVSATRDSLFCRSSRSDEGGLPVSSHLSKIHLPV